MQNILKTIGFIALPIFVVAILFLSARANDVQAHGSIKNGYQRMGHMVNSDFSHENHARLTPEQKQEMIGLMKQHHGDDWQNHHQQMHGSQSGT